MLLAPSVVKTIYLLMVREGIITLEQCEHMTERFKEFDPGTTLQTVAQVLLQEIQDQREVNP